MKALAIAISLTVLAFIVQRLAWAEISPFAWFLFYPTVFIASWWGGVRSGVLATLLSSALAWRYFVPPEGSWLKEEPKYVLSLVVFMSMGFLFSLFHGRLRKAKEDIQRLYEKTKEIDQLKSQFFANISHELRTPLTLILGPSERLLQAAEQSGTEHHELDIIMRNAHLLLRQVNNLLEVTKLEAGALSPAYAVTDVAGLVRFVSSHFELLADEKRIEYRVDAPETLRAQVDPEKLQRILFNLLSNAFKFTPRHGSIRVTLRTQDKCLVIEVADSGPGIPFDKRDAIFERFSQLETGAQRHYEGTGLGLHIARELIRLQHGDISVSDAPEGGALFEIKFPLAAPWSAVISTSSEWQAKLRPEMKYEVKALSLPTPAGEVAPSSNSDTRPRVLIVEDNVEMQRFISNSLADGYRIAVAFNGISGLEQAKALQPDLIVIDIMMPEMSGEALVQALRLSDVLKRVPVIILTANLDDDLRLRLLRQGVQDYLTKPFSVEELRVRVANLIAKKAADDIVQETIAKLRHENAGTAETVPGAENGQSVAQSRDDILGIVAHDLRNPLSVIAMQADFLRRDKLSREFGAQRIADSIERAANLMKRLIDDLLDVTRIKAQQLSIQKSKLAVSQLLSSVIETQKPLAQLAAIELVSNVQQPLPEIFADRDRLMQVFENLIGNAIKFTPAGGRITVGAAQKGAEILFWVTDTGSGIASEDLPRVFDRFWQARKSGKHSAGLGLPIVKGIVEAHGGRVWAESVLGQGSSFYVALPCA